MHDKLMELNQIKTPCTVDHDAPIFDKYGQVTNFMRNEKLKNTMMKSY